MNLRIAHGIVIDDREIQERFVRAMGKDRCRRQSKRG